MMKTIPVSRQRLVANPGDLKAQDETVDRARELTTNHVSATKELVSRLMQSVVAHPHARTWRLYLVFLHGSGVHRLLLSAGLKYSDEALLGEEKGNVTCFELAEYSEPSQSSLERVSMLNGIIRQAAAQRQSAVLNDWLLQAIAAVETTPKTGKVLLGIAFDLY